MKVLLTAHAKQQLLHYEKTPRQREFDRILDSMNTAVSIAVLIKLLPGTVPVAQSDSEEIYVMRYALARAILAFRPKKAGEIILAGVYLAGEDVAERLREALPVATALTRWK